MLHNLVWFIGFFLSILAVFVCAKTDRQEVFALNVMFTSLNTPSKLKGWKSSGGDPCGDSWEGITCKGSSVTGIQLSELELSGNLGYQLSNLKSVNKFDMSNNRLNGRIPYQLPPNVVHLDFSKNSLDGNVPYSLSQMSHLQSLNLGHNKLSGELQDIFQKLCKLETLDLSENQLKGKLPQSFENLTSLKTLHLQENQFTGSINVLRNLPLEDLNVEDNQFNGWIPNELKDIDSLLTGGNDWSTGNAPPPPPGVHYGRKSSDSQNRRKFAVVGVTIAGASVGILVLLAVLMSLVAKKKQSFSPHFIDDESSRHSKRFKSLSSRGSSQELRADLCRDNNGRTSTDSDASTDAPATQRCGSTGIKHSASSRVMTYSETEFANRLNAKRSASARAVELPLSDLQTATANFSRHLLLGEGSIGRFYRAKYPDGRIFAVKKIDSSFFVSGKAEEFSSLVTNISKIRHPNIVELVGYSLEQGQHLLIYEYFRNGSLHEFLHLSGDFSKPLTWNTRITIALGTARAIEYLHKVYSPPLVHKNIKSSNILLDAGLNPRLSDCGLGKFHLHPSENLGEGYSAPECKNPSAYTMKSDVYSFGVVMLELLTGRMPYDRSKTKFDQSLVEWATPQLHDIEALSTMVDPALCGLYPPKSLSQFANIIALCVQTELKFRPQMSEVVETLVRLVQRSSMKLKEDLSSSRRPDDSDF